VLATVAAFHTLRVAAELLMPIALALLGRFALIPVVRRLGRIGIPAPAAAVLVVGSLLGLGLLGATRLAEPATRWVERAPQHLRAIEQQVRSVREPVEQVVAATEDVADAATVRPKQRQLVAVEGPSLLSTVLDRTQSVLVTLLIATPLLLFLLASGDRFLDRGAALMLGRSDQNRMKRALTSIEESVSRHLLTITLVNAGLAVAVTLAMWLLEMPSPPLWGVLAGLLNFVPFVGAFVTAVILGAVALITFEDPMRAFVTVSVFLSLTSLEGFLVTPALLGRRLTLSAASVFVSVLVWSWLWGAAGALIAVPLLATFQILREQIGPSGLDLLLEDDSVAPDTEGTSLVHGDGTSVHAD
jgi:predicted PurR-regulated permease PerM